MDSKKSYIPLKVIISYLALAGLIVAVGWFLYSENKIFSETESTISKENNKILKVSNLLSNMYKTEGYARIVIQSNSENDFKNYTSKTDSLKLQIDSLKSFVTTQYQITLLDSVKYLLSKKTENIRQLKAIKNLANDETTVKKAISDLTKMESSLRKLQMEDFVKNPSKLGSYQRSVLEKYVAYMNQNIPDDSTNTLSKKASDSILSTSRTLLNQVKRENSKRKESLNAEENELLQNELSTSEQLRKILNIIEHEIIINTAKNNSKKEHSLKKTNQIVTGSAIIGFILTLFFSILILMDFSKTESYKKQLEIASAKTKTLLKNREQLISTVSHDLKTPLSTIVGYTELLGNSALNTKQTYYTKNIKGSSEYISQLVQDLLDFTQLEAGKITVENIPYSLDHIINQVAKSIQAVYEQKPIQLHIQIEEKLQNKIIGDPFRLRQILTNIIGNAYKFTEKGFIKIQAKINPENNYISIIIEDSGIGIKENKQQLIFEEFTQADDAIEKKYGGTGLGLTISKKMAEILGGKLILKSTFGKGSTFEIQIPLQFDKSSPNTEKTIISSKKLTAIIIDDDINLLQLTTEVLKQNQYTVYPFTKASEALEKIKTNNFDLIITDIQMPEMDGFTFLEKLKNTETNYKNQPIIAVTGRTDLEKETYTKAGFTQVISKPYSPKFLIKVINAIFSNTEIPVETNQETDNNTQEKPYTLKSLKTFLPDNDANALNEILRSFMQTTQENIKILEDLAIQNNIAEVKETAHRMNPMFKQIKANQVSQILDNLELGNNTIEQIKNDIETLKTQTTILFYLLKEEIV